MSCNSCKSSGLMRRIRCTISNFLFLAEYGHNRNPMLSRFLRKLWLVKLDVIFYLGRLIPNRLLYWMVTIASARVGEAFERRDGFINNEMSIGDMETYLGCHKSRYWVFGEGFDISRMSKEEQVRIDKGRPRYTV